MDEAKTKLPAHLSIEWMGDEPKDNPCLWGIYDTSVLQMSDEDQQRHTKGLLVYGIETREEAERIIREEFWGHIPAIVTWHSPVDMHPRAH
jgi:hypothetical protein